MLVRAVRASVSVTVSVLSDTIDHCAQRQLQLSPWKRQQGALQTLSSRIVTSALFVWVLLADSKFSPFCQQRILRKTALLTHHLSK